MAYSKRCVHMQCKDSDSRAVGRNLSNYERTYSSRMRGEGGDAESLVQHSLPYPEDVSFPWNESLSNAANRSSQRNIDGEERLASSFRAMGNEPLRERRRWLRPHILEPLGYQETDAPPLCTCNEESKQAPRNDSRTVSVICSHSKISSDVVPLQAQKFGQHHCAHVSCHELDPLPREQFGCTGNSPPTENLMDDDRFHCGSMTDSPGAARIPSPSSASSVTSGRRLEWDSGADVGYQNSHIEEKCSEVGLSTIERIALARGCSAALFERLDPEGTTGSGKKIKSFQGSHISFNSPLAKSTPVSQVECGIKAAVALKRKEVPPAPGQVLLPGGYLYIHSFEEHDNEGTPVIEEPTAAGRKEESGSNPGDLLENNAASLKKHSTSLTDLKNLEEDNALHSLPRSQSYLNVLTRENRRESSGGGSSGLPSSINPPMLGVAYSASSSSVATIVQKPAFSRTTSNKLIQTLPIKASIGVQTSLTCDNLNLENSPKDDSQIHGERIPAFKTSSRNSISEEAASEKTPSENTLGKKTSSEKVPTEKETHKCTGAYRKGTTFNGSSCSGSSQSASSRSQITSSAPILTSSNIKEFCVQGEVKHISDKGSGTLESGTSSTHTAASSCAAETSYSRTGQPTELRRESVGVVDSAHSFEYLPGHVYETALEASDSKSRASPSVNSNNKSSSEHKSERSEMSDKECTSSSPASLSKDIKDGVELLRELVAGKEFNEKAKKTLIRQIVNKLVDSDYKGDNSGSERSMPSSSNVPLVPTGSSSKHLPSGSVQAKTGERKSAGHASGCPRLKKTSSYSSLEEIQKVDAQSKNSSSMSSCLPSGSVSVPGDNEESNIESTGFSSHTPSDRAGMDWKQATSRSEREFERARSQSSVSSGSSSLMRFCRTEREKQLHWIRFEIDHLKNLKQLLEKQEGLTKSLSKLTTHEHKYHQNIKPKNSKPCRVQRLEEVATHSNESSGSGSSACVCCQHKFHPPSDGSGKMQPSSSIESQEWNARIRKSSQTKETSNLRVFNDRHGTSEKEDAHDVSVQTLTLDSYTLSNADAVNQDSKDGRINVCSQTSPRAKHTQVHQDSQTSLPRVGANEAKESYHLATKCCCECMKALEEIVEKGFGRQKAKEQLGEISTSCGCQTENLSPNELRRESSQISNVDSSSISIPNASDTSKNNKDITDEEVSLRQRASVATETVVSKSCQTSGSLKKLPVIRPAWYMTESHEDEEGKTSRIEMKNKHKNSTNDVCPCCGLLVNQARVHRKSSSQSKSSSAPRSCESKSSDLPSGSTKQQIDASIPQSKVSSVHDVSAQTEVQKSPLAYLLTFEPTTKENIRQGRGKSLPEVKIFVPPPPDSNNSNSSSSSKCKGTKTNAKENSRPVSRQPISSCKLVEVDVEGHDEKTDVQTLQEYLKANRPDYLEHADKRSKCLADLAVLRELRKRKRLELMAMTARKEAAENAKDGQLRPSKSCSSVPKRLVLSKREMREHTERKYQRSHEVQNKLAERKKKEDFRTNRLMAELFTRKLQKKVLKGVVNHSNAASVISSI